MRVRFLISGRVQGVGFRWFAARHADRLRVGGYVRNLDDGRVEVEAVGDATALADLERELRRGPRSAIVTGVEKTVISDEDNAVSPFRIID